MNRERLSQLADMLDGIAGGTVTVPGLCTFDLGIWKCDTAACAIGWACCHEPFRNQGLCLNENDIPQFKDHYSLYAARHLFEISYEDAEALFLPTRYCLDQQDDPLASAA